MENTDSVKREVLFEKDIDSQRLAKIIEKKGGTIRNNRAFFNINSHEFVSQKTKYQAYNAYRLSSPAGRSLASPSETICYAVLNLR